RALPVLHDHTGTLSRLPVSRRVPLEAADPRGVLRFARTAPPHRSSRFEGPREARRILAEGRSARLRLRLPPSTRRMVSAPRTVFRRGMLLGGRGAFPSLAREADRRRPQNRDPGAPP